MAKKLRKIVIGSLFIAAIVVVVILALNNSLTIRSYEEPTEKILKPIRLVVLTDLHDTMFGSDESELVSKVREQNPDLVLLVGDIADEFGEHKETRMLLADLCHENKCFYVTGNHEYWSYKIEEIKELIRSENVTILEGNSEFLDINGQRVSICGVDDPDGFDTEYAEQARFKSWKDQLNYCKSQIIPGVFSILLSHRPEKVEAHINSGFDLVLAGHAHGGQIRIPGILNGLYAPDQGFFPKFAGGRYQLGETTMIVSRGLSLKKGIPRVFNPPEFVVVDLLPINKKDSKIR